MTLRVTISADAPAWIARAVEAAYDTLRPRGVRLIVVGWSSIDQRGWYATATAGQDLHRFVEIRADPASDESAMWAREIVWLVLATIQEFVLPTEDTSSARLN